VDHTTLPSITPVTGGATGATGTSVTGSVVVLSGGSLLVGWNCSGCARNSGSTFNLNLGTAFTVSVTSPSSGFTPTTSVSDTPYGAFTNGFNCSSAVCGTGGNNPFAGPLNFNVTDASGILISNFVLNSDNIYFAADVLGPSGGTGSIGANSFLPSGGGGQGTTPLPAALPLFATGLGVMGWLAKRRKQKAPVALAA
jgi:hypothetical protein